ncbi:UPF0481 protein At3g47200 [Cajanus cajan]|uniref:UPF0481 protein At3g47200 n=1 Tax=Cajanus cajan TaxID=3821 RepID=UPI0010FAF5A7|nr:UPF0481 protein At3g47200 [Cajanus cajan]
MLQLVSISRRAERCIFRVPERLRKSNSQAYTPRVVSIGHFHKANCALEPMEEVKLKYLKAFLNRTTLCVGHFVVKLQELENKIRSFYAEPIDYSSNDFLKMVLIDTSFIIEYSLRYYEGGDWWENDPLLLNQFLREIIYYDLILLENQLPYFVLEDIYNLTGMHLKFRSFHEIIFRFFHDSNSQGKNVGGLREYPKHFLDLIRYFQLPSSFDLEALETNMVVGHLYSASQLSGAGLEFTADTAKGLEKDVNILIDKKIITNWIGDKNVVLNLFNNLGFIGMPYFNSKYLSICKSLNSFYENPCNQYKITLRREYFNTPWKTASTVAAIVLLLLTLIQTICSIIQLF